MLAALRELGSPEQRLPMTAYDGCTSQADLERPISCATCGQIVGYECYSGNRRYISKRAESIPKCPDALAQPLAERPFRCALQ
jgi:hypothetical protein